MKYTSQSPRFRDITGITFGRLKVIDFAEIRGRQAYWHCLCECGTTAVVQTNKLKSGHTRSCGCLQREVVAKLSLSHGMSQSPEYRIWSAVKARCDNPKNISYKYYGAKGIGMCRRWKRSFSAFFRDMGMRPSPRHSIERRQTNKGYCPSNCYWGTPIEQGSNTSRNHFLVFKGERQTVSEWSRRYGISPATIVRRLSPLGWSVADAITKPSRIKSRQLK